MKTNAREKFLDRLIEKGESIDDIENCDLIDFNRLSIDIHYTNNAE